MNKESKKKKINKFWIIGIIVELIIIGVVLYFEVINKKYDDIIECSKVLDKSESGYTQTVTNVFYIKDNKTIKQKVIYNNSFQYATVYDKFKEEVEQENLSSTTNGFKIETKDDENNLVYQIVYEYDYNKLKEVSSTLVENNKITFVYGDKTISIYEYEKNQITKDYEALSYTCKESY